MSAKQMSRVRIPVAIVVILTSTLFSGCDPQNSPWCEQFTTQAENLVRWDGSRWHAVDNPSMKYLVSVGAQTEDQDSLIVLGHYGIEQSDWLAWWEPRPNRWHVFPGKMDRSGFGSVAIHGRTIYLGGDTYNIRNEDGSTVDGVGLAKWTGSRWEAVPGIKRGRVVRQLIVGDSLYIAGEFELALPHTGRNLACLNLRTGEWMPIGSPNARVNALTRSEDMLYIGGLFTSIDGMPARTIARLRLGQPTWEAFGGIGVLPDAPDFSIVMHIKFRSDTVYAVGRLTSNVDSSIFAYWVGSEMRWVTPREMPADVTVILPTNRGVFVGGQFTSVGSLKGLSNIAMYLPRSDQWSRIGGSCSTEDDASGWPPESNVYGFSQVGTDVYMFGLFNRIR